MVRSLIQKRSVCNVTDSGKNNGDAAPIFLVQDGTAQYVSKGPVTWTSPDNYYANSKANDVWTLRMDITGNACMSDPNCTAPHSGHSASFTPGTMKIYSDQTWPTLNFPTDYSFTGSSSNPRVVFQWGPLPNADSYKLFIDDSSDPSNVFTVKTISTTSTNFDTASDSSIQLQALHTYSWKVAAVNAVGTGYDSGSRQFIVGPTAECWPALGGGYGNSGYQNDIHSCYNLGSSTGNFLLKDISRRGNMNVHSHNGNMSDNASISTQRYGEYGPMSSGNSFWGIDADAGERPGVDAHVNAGKVYDYLWSTLLLSSPDGQGNSMLNIVESTEVAGNAWFSTHADPPTINFSAGVPYSSSLGIVAHEWAHVITGRATLRGRADFGLGVMEAGALEEAFSDWVGLAIRRAQPNGDQSWIIEIGNQRRDVASPHNSVPTQPETYGEPGLWKMFLRTSDCNSNNDWCEVHDNSGVPNKMFFLLSEPGTHTFNNVTVTGIGIDKAIKIAQTANMKYWKQDLIFKEARDGMIKAAQELNFTRCCLPD